MRPRHRSWTQATCALIALLVGAGVCASSAAPERQESVFHTLSVAGTPFECGRAQGQAFAPKIREFVQAAGIAMLSTPDELRSRARALDRFVADHHREEMRGIAAGAGLAYEDILVLNCWYELSMVRFACRQVVTLGPTTRSGKLIHGRNLDWFSYGGLLSDSLLVLDIRPDGGRRMTLITWPGMIGALTATDERGMTVAMNQLGGGVREGEPVFLLMRRVLEEADDLDAAVEMLTSAPATVDAAIGVSESAADEAVCVEWAGGEAAVVRAEEGILAADNSRHTPDWARRQTEMALWTRADAVRGKVTPEIVREILQAPDVIQGHNLYSCVFVPDQKVLYLASGRSPAARLCTFARIELFPDTGGALGL